jgi:hypothetical protein
MVNNNNNEDQEPSLAEEVGDQGTDDGLDENDPRRTAGGTLNGPPLIPATPTGMQITAAGGGTAAAGGGGSGSPSSPLSSGSSTTTVLSCKCRRHVSDMSATCQRHATLSLDFADTGLSQRHKINLPYLS